MPVYAYTHTCPHGGEVEIEHKLCDPTPKCETCGRPMKQLIAGKTGVAFKGTGWYQSDYKGKK